MRLRGRKGTREDLEKLPELVALNPAEYKGKWAEFFGNERPIHVEIGMGKGKFIGEISMRQPDINFIGIDKYDELLIRAVDKAKKLRAENPEHPGDLSNLRLALADAERIGDIFAEGEIERIYLNFSDPWPKKRHIRRRLTHPRYIRQYIRLLNENGTIHLKTDSPLLFEYSLNVFSDMGLRLRAISLDLHREKLRDDLILTEYEMKFIEQGKPIYRCEVIVGEKALREHLEALARAEEER